MKKHNFHLSIAQLITFAAFVVFWIIGAASKWWAWSDFEIHFNSWGNWKNIMLFIIWLVVTLIGIWQIFAGSASRSHLAIIAGICALLTYIIYVFIAAFIVNIIVLLNSRSK